MNRFNWNLYFKEIQIYSCTCFELIFCILALISHNAYRVDKLELEELPDWWFVMCCEGPSVAASSPLQKKKYKTINSRKISEISNKVLVPKNDYVTSFKWGPLQYPVSDLRSLKLAQDYESSCGLLTVETCFYYPRNCPHFLPFPSKLTRC